MAAPAVTIRRRTPDDCEALVDLDVASARHHAAIDPELYHLPDRAAVTAFLERRLSEPAGEVLERLVYRQHGRLLCRVVEEAEADQ